MNKEQTIAAIQSADISKQDWDWEIRENIDSQYAKGYVSATMGRFNGVLSEDSEDYRDELLRVCGYDIWK